MNDMTQTLARKYEELKGKLKEQGKDIDSEIERLLKEGKAVTRSGAVYTIGRDFEIEYSPAEVKGIWLGIVPDPFNRPRSLVMKKFGEVVEVRDFTTEVLKYSLVIFADVREALHKPSGKSWIDGSKAKAEILDSPSLDNIKTYSALPKDLSQDEMQGVVGTVMNVSTGVTYNDDGKPLGERSLFFTDKAGKKRMHLGLKMISGEDPTERFNVNLMFPPQLLEVYPEVIENPDLFLKRLEETYDKEAIFSTIGALQGEGVFAIGRAGTDFNGQKLKTPYINVDDGMAVNIGKDAAFTKHAPAGLKIASAPISGKSVEQLVMAEFAANNNRLKKEDLLALSKRENVGIEAIQDVIQLAFVGQKVKKESEGPGKFAFVLVR